jgi:hypothetical protein
VQISAKLHLIKDNYNAKMDNYLLEYLVSVLTVSRWKKYPCQKWERNPVAKEIFLVLDEKGSSKKSL